MRVSLRLYVTSSSPQTEEVITRLDQMKTKHRQAEFDVEVVDVLADPLKAERDQISVTPTLLILSPLPMRKIISGFESLDKELGL